MSNKPSMSLPAVPGYLLFVLAIIAMVLIVLRHIR